MQNSFNYQEQNESIQKALKSSIETLFPVKSGGKVLSITNVKIEDNLSETDFPAQQEVKANRKN